MAGGDRGPLRRLRLGTIAITFAALAALGGCADSPAEEAAPAGFAPPDPASPPPIDALVTPTTTAASAAAARATSTAGSTTTLALTTTAPATTAATTTTEAPTTTVDPDLGNVTMVFAGDALWHSPLWRGAQANFAAGHDGAAGYDFTPMLADIAPLISSADLGVCHLETPIAPEGEEFTTYPNYGVPPEVVSAIAWAGFDRCSTASNHTLDRGLAGIDRTVNVLLGNGLGQSGMARTPQEIEPIVFVVDAVAISHLSYTFGYNGKRMPAGQEWRSALLDSDRVIADARAAREMGAELVIVSLHWGVEGSPAVTAEQRRVAEAITASGAVDLIVGHHAHVLQPIEQVNGVWVIYGLGNMISNMPTGGLPQAATQDGAVVTIGFQRRPEGGFDVSVPVVHPTWVDRHNGWVIRLVQPSLAAANLADGVRGQMESSLARTSGVLGPYVSPP